MTQKNEQELLVNQTISLKEDLKDASSWPEAFIINRSLMASEERVWVDWFIERTVGNPKHDNAVYGVYDLLRELVTRFRQFPKPEHSERLRAAMEELEGDYDGYRAKLFNPRIRFALKEGKDEQYETLLGVALLPDLPPALITSWDGLMPALRTFPAALTAILRGRSIKERDIFDFNFINKVVHESGRDDYNDYGMELALIFSEDHSRDFRERFSIICNVMRAGEDQWEMEERESGYPSRRKTLFSKLYKKLMEEVRFKDDVPHGVPDSWVEEMYLVEYGSTNS